MTTMRPAPGDTIGRVAELFRYPVKSLVGEPRDEVRLDHRGIAGDRLWSVRDGDGKLGSGKNSRRFRRMDGLLDLSATYDGDTPVIAFPGGAVVRGDDPGIHAALTGHLGLPVMLAREADVSHFDEGPIHLVTTSSMRVLEQAHGRDVEIRRLRPNLLVNTGEERGLVEDDLVGCRVAIGPDVVLQVRSRLTRCVMVDLPQIGMRTDGRLLKTISRLNETQFGVLADVARGGVARFGDPVRLSD